jgi:hypothetical protein
VARDNVVPFLGPHISVGRGNEPGLPSPRELADELARRLGYTDTNQTLSRVGQHFELQQGRHALLSFLNKQLLNPNQPLLAAHRMTATLPYLLLGNKSKDYRREPWSLAFPTRGHLCRGHDALRRMI